MDLRELQNQLNTRFSGMIIDWVEKSPRRVYLEIEPPALREVARKLFEDLKFRFCTASAVQNLAGFQVLYHFSFDGTGLILSVRVKLGKDNPEIDSISDLVPATDWIEREMNELFGIKFRRRPDLARLLLAEDWPEGVYPLRKDYRERS